MNQASFPKLSFTQEFDESLADMVREKGWCGLGVVELPNGTRVDVFFYDPIRLASDLWSLIKDGGACVAYPNMIVVPEVTREYMDAAVKELYNKGYFDSYKPTKG
jgi:hypothetical protein